MTATKFYVFDTLNKHFYLFEQNNTKFILEASVFFIYHFSVTHRGLILVVTSCRVVDSLHYPVIAGGRVASNDLNAFITGGRSSWGRQFGNAKTKCNEQEIRLR